MSRIFPSIQTISALICVVVLSTIEVLPISEKSEAIAQEASKQELPIELQYVPADAALFVSADAIQILDNPILKSFRKADPDTFDALITLCKKAFGFSPEEVKALVLFLPKIQPDIQQVGMGAIVTFRNRYDKEKVAVGMKSLLPKNTKSKVVALSEHQAIILIDLDDDYAKPQPAGKSGPLSDVLKVAAAGKHAAVVGLNPANFPEILRGEDVPSELRPFQPLFKAVAIRATVDLGKTMGLDVRVKTATAGQAVECEKALTTLLGLMHGALDGEAKAVEADSPKKPDSKDLLTIMKAASTALQNAKYSTLGNETELTVSLSSDLPFTSAYFAVKQRIESEQNLLNSSNNLKQIGLATINYADAMNGNLPPAAICDKTGKPLLSWRVLILPYLEQQALFNEFKLDEPWDSAHNKKLLAKMPKLYAMPGQTKPGGTETYYRVFVGKGAGFDWLKGARFPADITDGTSNTMMCVTAKHAVPWTKPDELEFDPEKDMRDLLGGVNGKLQFGMFDGSVHTSKKMPSKETIHALITRAGGEVPGDDFP